jgi:CMP-N-acetylneuraminic acid synthetase
MAIGEVGHRSSAAIAVIPARGGSKRVPGKNVRMLSGRPAIAYTIDAAVGSGVFGRVIVSTDNSDIADIAIACGAEVPFTRSASISDDYTPVSAVTIDAIQRADPSGHFGIVAQLMANCPLRTADDVVDGFSQFISVGAEIQLSVSRYGWLNPWWAMTIDESHRLNLVHDDNVNRRSQDLPQVFALQVPCGSGRRSRLFVMAHSTWMDERDARFHGITQWILTTKMTGEWQSYC